MWKIQTDINTETKKSVERILQYPRSNIGGLEVVRMVRHIRESSRFEKSLISTSENSLDLDKAGFSTSFVYL